MNEIKGDTMTSTTYSLQNVEDGYAEVIRPNGRRCGMVSREKWGSTRTGTMWFAFVGRKQIGSGFTRKEAVAIVIAHNEEHEARVAAFLAQ